MKRFTLTLCAVMMVTQTGCSIVNGMKKFSTDMASTMRPDSYNSSEDYDDANKVDRDHEQMMMDARRGSAASKEPDGWFSNWFYSEEGRSIERSLGVEYY